MTPPPETPEARTAKKAVLLICGIVLAIAILVYVGFNVVHYQQTDTHQPSGETQPALSRQG